MVIAVYANLKVSQLASPYHCYIKSLIQSLAIAYPQIDFYIIQHYSIIDFVENLQNLHIISLPHNRTLFDRFFLKRKIVKAIKNLKPKALLSVDSATDFDIPQFILIEDVGSMQNVEFVNWKKPVAIFCLSQAIKTEIINENKIEADKIHVVYGGPVKALEPFAEEIKTGIKEMFTNGKEFFLYRGPIDKEQNIITLLKAFSVFKKRQKSSMKLVMIGKIGWEESVFSKLIDTYKYKDEVVFVDETNEATASQLVAAAFAFIQPYRSNSLCFVWNSLQSEVPVLINNDSPLSEIAPGAALYFDATKSDDIADKLMMVYKDEKLKQELIEKGKELVLNYTLDLTIELLAQNLLLTGN